MNLVQVWTCLTLWSLRNESIKKCWLVCRAQILYKINNVNYKFNYFRYLKWALFLHAVMQGSLLGLVLTRVYFKKVTTCSHPSPSKQRWSRKVAFRHCLVNTKCTGTTWCESHKTILVLFYSTLIFKVSCYSTIQ